MRDLGKTPPDWALEDVKEGGYEFTTVEAYYGIIEGASKTFGPMGEGWALRLHEGYPRIEEWTTGKGKRIVEAVCVADFLYVNPNTGEPARWPVTVGGGSKAIRSAGDAMMGAITRCISKALSYLGFAYKIYSGQHKGGKSMDTHLAARAYDDENGWDGPPAEAPSRAATPPPERQGRRSSSSGGGRRRGPPPGWIACQNCGNMCKPLVNKYGPFISCRSCGADIQNLTRAELQHAEDHGEYTEDQLTMAYQALDKREAEYGD